MACSWRDSPRRAPDARKHVPPLVFRHGKSLRSKLRPRLSIVHPWCRAAAATRLFPVHFSLTNRNRTLADKLRWQFPGHSFRFRRRTHTVVLQLRPAIRAMAAAETEVAGSSVAKSPAHSPRERL